MRQTIRPKGQKIGEARLSRGWPQKTLSEESGVSRATICQIEQGKGATMKTASKIAQALQQPIEELFEITIS